MDLAAQSTESSRLPSESDCFKYSLSLNLPENTPKRVTAKQQKTRGVAIGTTAAPATPQQPRTSVPKMPEAIAEPLDEMTEPVLPPEGRQQCYEDDSAVKLKRSETAKFVAVLKAHTAAMVMCTIFGVIFGLCAVLTDTAMGLKGWYSIWVTTVVLVLLSAESLPPALAFVFSLMLLTVPGVITMREAVIGFGNELVFTIGLLYILSRGIQESTLLNYAIKHVLGHPTSLEAALARLVFSVMLLSAGIHEQHSSGSDADTSNAAVGTKDQSPCTAAALTTFVCHNSGWYVYADRHQR